MGKLRSFLRDTRGVTSIEYAMIASFISLAVVAGATAIGTRLNGKFIGPVTNGLT